MIERLKGVVGKLTQNQKLRKFFGLILVIAGLILHLIPLFPAGWIVVLGLELLGIRLLLQDKIKCKLNNNGLYCMIKKIKFRLFNRK